jgi:histone H1/5
MSNPEPVDPTAVNPSSNKEEALKQEENHQSDEELDESIVEHVKPAAGQGEGASAHLGENGGTPKKETVAAVDMVTTPTEETKKVGSAKKKSSKKSTAKKPAESGPKSPYTPKKNGSGKLSYLEMVHEAIAHLKDRTGSSTIAIQKWIKAKYADKAAKPDVVKNNVAKAIKQGVKEKRLVQIKNSFKINPEWTTKQKAAAKAKDAAKKKAAAKVKKELEKKKAKLTEEEEKKKAEEAERKRLEEMTPEQRAAEAKAKAKAEILRKRRYPMEDTKLHSENKEYGIKNEVSLNRRPALPYTLTSLIAPHLRPSDNPKWGPIMAASQSGAGEWTEMDNDRGLIADALHVYHFFMGDVGFEDEKYPVPKFSFKTLLYALDEIIIGNSKAAKSLPPLISHLFLTALRVLTAGDTEDNKSKASEYIDPVEAQLQKDLARIGLGLNAVSWSQILFFYMDLMERYYQSDASLDIGVMPGDDDLDMSYIWDKSQAGGKSAKPDDQKKEPHPGRNYRAYLGNPKGVFYKAYTKLSNQAEPWNLTADELMALLRALTDDILSMRADLAADITERGLQLDELKKAKNQAMFKFRKARSDFEGPTRKQAKKKIDSEESGKLHEAGDANNEAEEGNEKEEPFKPKISKKDFLAAEKNYNKAMEAFDSGIRKLVSRTEPLGFDRNFNSYYCFVHDPEMMHVEQLKQANLPPEIKRLGVTLNPSSSWHFIDTKPLFEQFIGCLDVRGTREHELYEVSSTLTILKRNLQDDKKDNARPMARAREKEALEKRLENARTACDAEEGRRSGRLAGQAIDEVKKLEVELQLLLEDHEKEEQLEKLGRERASDYTVLTGLEMVTDLGSGKRDVFSLQDVPCHELWLNKKAGGNGTLHAVAEALLEMEVMCNELSPWRREDMTRDAWRKQLSEVSSNWAKECTLKLGPSPKEPAESSTATDKDSESQSPSKKQKVDERPFLANTASIVRVSFACHYICLYLYNPSLTIF